MASAPSLARAASAASRADAASASKRSYASLAAVSGWSRVGVGTDEGGAAPLARACGANVSEIHELEEGRGEARVGVEASERIRGKDEARENVPRAKLVTATRAEEVTHLRHERGDASPLADHHCGDASATNRAPPARAARVVEATRLMRRSIRIRMTIDGDSWRGGQCHVQ